MSYVIYVLLDPRDTTARYVGMTNDITERFIQHLRMGEVNSEKNLWIHELKGQGLLPICRTLEVVQNERDARQQERAWIMAFMEIEQPLFNVEATGRQR